MNSKANHVTFPLTRVVVMMVFLSATFLASANVSFAAPANQKTPGVARTTAVEHNENRIKELQSVLKITADQEKLWNTIMQVMRDNAKELDVLMKDRAEKTKTMNAVEQLKFHSQITQTRLNQMQKFIPLFEELYASMSDEQKKNADTIFQKGIMRKNKKK